MNYGNKVLIVDDDEGMLNFISDLIGNRFDVITASDGQAAMQAISLSGPPDLLITDYHMTPVDGVHLILSLAHKRAPLKKVILMSADLPGQHILMELALRLGPETHFAAYPKDIAFYRELIGLQPVP